MEMNKIVAFTALLGLAALFHSDDYIALFVSCIDIPVGFGSLFQRIASIDDGVYLSRLNQLCEELDVLRVFTCCPGFPGDDLLAAAHRSPSPANPL